MNLRYPLILAILLLSLASSILLSFAPLSTICTSFEGCNAVQTSSYAQTFGIHNSDIGIAIFALMILVTISHIRKPSKKKKTIIYLGVFIGTLVSLYFLYLQQFVLHAWCKYCLVIDIGMLVAFAIINIPDKKKLGEEKINIQKEVIKMSQEILNQGAEAIITKRGNEITKKRIEKSYRIKEIDDRIRKLRTRSEAKILEKASKIIPVPRVLKVDETSKEIIMENIDGIRLSDSLDSFSLQKQKEICEKIGENISKLHNENIIHGDLTPSNMIFNDDFSNNSDYAKEKEVIGNSSQKRGDINQRDSELKRGDIKVFFIDFGLGFISAKIEDRAVDLHLLREALEAGFAENRETFFDSVKKGYSKDYKDAKLVLERFKAVEKRGRYKQGS